MGILKRTSLNLTAPTRPTFRKLSSISRPNFNNECLSSIQSRRNTLPLPCSMMSIQSLSLKQLSNSTENRLNNTRPMINVERELSFSYPPLKMKFGSFYLSSLHAYSFKTFLYLYTHSYELMR